MVAKEGKEKKPRRVGKRAAAKAEAAAGESGSNVDPAMKSLTKSAEKLNLENNRSSTGVLTSEKNSRDVKVCSLCF